jgi:hypothetical protein
MRKDDREFIRQLEAAGLTVESTPGYYHVLRDGKHAQRGGAGLDLRSQGARGRRGFLDAYLARRRRLLTTTRRG